MSGTMKRLSWATVMVSISMFVAQAVPVPVTVTRVSGYYSGSGGEFTILGSPWANPNHYSSPTLVSGGFQSFCVELDEFVSGTRFAELNTAAVHGGKGGPSPDPVSKGTAWLYKQFAEGNLLGYNYTPGSGRETSAVLLQEAIWVLEDELTGPSGPNAYLAMVITKYGNLTNARDDHTDADGFRVRVLNMWGKDPTSGNIDYNQPKQDMLVYLPDGGLTLVLLGGGLLGLAVWRRKV